MLRKLLVKNIGLKRTWQKWAEVAVEHDILVKDGAELEDPKVVELDKKVDKLEERMKEILEGMETIVKGENE